MLPTCTNSIWTAVPCDNFFEARNAVCFGVLTHFDADPTALHFVGDGSGGAGAQEGVEDEVAGVGGNMKYSAN